MRAYSWIALATVALACSGSAFTANDEGAGGADGEAGSSAGGKVSGGGKTGSAGKVGSSGSGSGGKASTGGTISAAGQVSTGGLVGIGGNLGLGGELVVGGTFSVAGTTSAAGTASTAGTGGTGPDPIDKACPKALPTAGGLCAGDLVCSYTADVRTDCRPIAKCNNGKWAVEKPECEALHACPALQVGAKCDSASAKPCMLNATDGIYCVCTGCGNGGPCSSETTWACAAGSGGASCPKLPPNKGQMCSVDTPCGYGSCSTSNSVSAVCEGGVWGWDGVACPL